MKIPTHGQTTTTQPMPTRRPNPLHQRGPSPSPFPLLLHLHLRPLILPEPTPEPRPLKPHIHLSFSPVRPALQIAHLPCQTLLVGLPMMLWLILFFLFAHICGTHSRRWFRFLPQPLFGFLSKLFLGFSNLSGQARFELVEFALCEHLVGDGIILLLYGGLERWREWLYFIISHV